MAWRVLVVVAVDVEADAVRSGAGESVDVLVGGVGSAAAAARTGIELAEARASGNAYHIVVSMGIGGGFAGRAAIGDIVVASASVAADLGAQSPDGFRPVTALGFGQDRIEADAVAELTERIPGARSGEILTVNTVTGTAERAAELAERHPNALVEAMEGYGVACAAQATGTRFAEVRAVSNAIGPRDRSAWRIAEALAALSIAAAGVGTLVG